MAMEYSISFGRERNEGWYKFSPISAHPVLQTTPPAPIPSQLRSTVGMQRQVHLGKR